MKKKRITNNKKHYPKRYLVFAVAQYEAAGGVDDIKLETGCIKKAKEKSKQLQANFYDEVYILDIKQWRFFSDYKWVKWKSN